MNNLELKLIGVLELSMEEVLEVEGGRKIPWKDLAKWGDRLLTVAGVYDAASDFVDGWNSVK